MKKKENIISELRQVLLELGHTDLSELLSNSKSRLLVSSTYGSKLYSQLSTLEIYSPIKETSKLNSLEGEKKQAILNAVLMIYPIQENEPEISEIIYKIDLSEKIDAMVDWNKVIFLAHASEDKPIVRKIYKRLKAEGLEPWLDEENLEPGVKWDDKIKEAIRNSRFFLACLSNHSIAKNGYIQKELKMALQELEQKASDVIYFIPALIEDVGLPNVSVGTINLRDYQAVKIFDEGGFNKLVEHLKKQANIIQEIKKQENPDFAKLRNAVAHGEIETSLRLLRELLEQNNSDLYNNVILLSSRFSELKKLNVLGMISHEQYQIDNSKIIYSILEIIKLAEGT